MQNARKINVLELRLSRVESGHYHVEGLVDGQPLLRDEGDEMGIPFGLLPSIHRDGDYFMVTCSCGDAGCAGYFDPVVVSHEGDLIRWTGGDGHWDFTFRRDQYASEIRGLINEGRALLRRNPKVESIHQNINLFRDEDYEAGLPWYWDNNQRNRAEERARGELLQDDPEGFRQRYGPNPIKTAARLVLYLILLPLLVPIWLGMLICAGIVEIRRGRSQRGRSR